MTGALRAWNGALILCSLAARPRSLHSQVDPLDRAPSRFAMFEGVRLHYKSLGTGRSAVVLVHCWACDLTFWRQQIAPLEGRIRLVLLDLPGHGRSDRPVGAYSMDRFARATNAVLETAGVDQAVLVGHSMGTPVVRQFYRLFPKKTLGLVAVDGSLRSILKDSLATRRVIQQLESPDYRRALEQLIAPMFPNEALGPLQRVVLQSALGTPQHVLVGSIRGMLDPAIWADDPILVPLLVVVAKGPNWPPDYQAYVRSLSPEARYEEIDGVGHFLTLEKPATFNPILVGFLASLGLLRS